MTTPIAETKGLDPLARASSEPDVDALISEFTLAQEWGPNQTQGLGLAEGTRFNRWEGQTTDGLRWQKFQPPGTVVRPYDGRPDTRQNLADSVINALVDIDMVALWSAQSKPSPTHANRLTAGQSAELRALVRWMMEGPLRADLVDGAEYLSQMKHTIGWCVLHPCWQVKHGLKREKLTLEQFQELAAKAPEGSELAMLAGMIMGTERAGEEESPESRVQSPESEENSAGEVLADGEPDSTLTAAEILRKVYPYLKANTAKRIVRELRADGETEFLYREVQENRPRLKVLVPGIDVFLPEEVQDARDSRAWFVRDYYSEADLRAMVANEDWDEGFVEAAVQTAGRVSQAGEGVGEQMRDKNNRRIEILTSYVRQTDDDGIPGIYCTVFSAFVPAQAATHYLLDYAHGQYPFLIARTEIIGPRPDDSRGVPTVLRTQQWEMKRQRDNVHILSELRTNPPRLRIGFGWSKAQESFAPGSDVTNTQSGAALKYLEPPNDNGSLALGLCELIRSESEDYYGLPRAKTESHPSRWQARQMRTTTRWLLTWGQALWQLAVLAYDTYEPEEMAEIIGRQALLSAQGLLKHQLNMNFDARTMDPEWVEMVLKNVGQIRGWNTGGTIDDNKLVNFALAYLDPTLAEEVTSDKQGAANAIYKDVEHTIMSIMQGNKPQLSENDPTAGMKLQFAQQILQQNQEYQKELLPQMPNQQGQPQPNPQFNEAKAKNMQTYFENLQHNVQETQTSKVQGRVGVQDINSAPIQSGPGQ